MNLFTNIAFIGVSWTLIQQTWVKVSFFEVGSNILNILLATVLIISLSTTGLHVATEMETADKWEAGSSLSECSIITDSKSVSSAQMEGSHTKNDPVSSQYSDMDVRYPCEPNSLSEDCSTTRVRQLEDNRAFQRNRSTGTVDRGKRKRWRGRDETFEVASEAFTGSCCKYGVGGATALPGCTNLVRSHD